MKPPSNNGVSRHGDAGLSMTTMEHDESPESYLYEDDTVATPNARSQTGVKAHEEDELMKVSNSSNIRCFKRTLTVAVFLLGAAVATTAYLCFGGQEKRTFQESFNNDATKIIDSFYQQHSNRLWILYSMGAAYKSLPTQAFPNMTLPNFESQTLGDLRTANAASLFFAPLLYTMDAVDSWMAYAIASQDDAGIDLDNIFARSIEDGIFCLDETLTPSADNYTDERKAPIWQINPAVEKRHLNMLNLYCIQPKLFQTLQAYKVPVLGTFLTKPFADFFSSGKVSHGPSSPRSLVIMPISIEDKIAAVVGAEIDWLDNFRGVLSDGPAIHVVLRNSCEDKTYTLEVVGDSVILLGDGDLHNAKFDDMKEVTTVDSIIKHTTSNNYPEMILPADASIALRLFCVYTISIYPTEDYEAESLTSLPLIFTLVSVAMTSLIMLCFAINNFMVDRRQRQVLEFAAKSNAIIKSLFPAVVLNKMFGEGMSAHSSSHTPRNTITRRLTMNRVASSPSTGEDFPSANPKHRLTNFLSSSFSNEVEPLVANQEDEPIAEMFSNTTVMFADIAGFTAWSSEREPAQVFKLLESVYQAFDEIANRLGVFKVETIGDCYVAVTGLPEPNKEHAKVMARFAYEILLTADQLTGQLEAILGPGTSDLDLRVGLHSGPVTAGVLRGTKSRFQLFGDTMNTASRMESTGQAGKIQVSESTADLIAKAGKHYWLTKRDGTVSAKGKGEMQTYWLMIRRASNKSDVIADSKVDVEEEMDFDKPVISPKPPQPPQHDTLRAWGQMVADNESITSRHSLTMKQERLIEWNVEVLMSFLEKVVQHRLVTETRGNRWGQSLVETITEISDDQTGEKDIEMTNGLIIDEVAEVITLPKFDARYAIPSVTSNKSKLLPPEIRNQMKDFVASVASMYRDTPFHNFDHASHVTLSANKLMKRIITPEDSTKSKKKGGVHAESELHVKTFGISSDPLTQFAVVFGALIHDIDHTGLTNAQLVKEGATIARIFKNKSVAEQNSVVVAWELLMEPRFADLQQCIFAHDSGRKRFRQLVVNVVMATDILDADMLALRKKRWEKAFDPALSNHLFLLDVDVNRKATIVIEHIIQASDVAHTMQHWRIFIKWNTKLYREMYQGYINGHSTKDPSEGWYEGQLSFFDNYVIPLAKKLRECGVFGVSGDEYLTYAQLNRAEWEQKGQTETRDMIQMNKGLATSGMTISSCGSMTSSSNDTGFQSMALSTITPPSPTFKSTAKRTDEENDEDDGFQVIEASAGAYSSFVKGNKRNIRK